MADSIADLLQDAARLHRDGALEEACGRYRQVLQGEPEHAQALYHLAVIGCQQGRLGHGVELARRSLASDPRQPRAYNLMGMALSRLGRHAEALVSFDAALVEQPDFADAHGNRASALMELGRLADALASYQRAVALEPNSIGDLLNLGTALHRVGRHEDAIASFDRALALHSGFPEAHLNRGNVLAHLGCYEEALASFDRVLAVNRRQLDALGARARALIALDRIEGALVNLEEMLAIAPDHAGALDQLAVLLARGENARVLATVMRAVAAKETSAARALFVQCVKNRKFNADPGGSARTLLLRALSEPWDRPADLAVPIASLVKLNPAIKDACARADHGWPRRLVLEDLSGRLTAIVDDQLLCMLLETVPVCDVALERCLTGMRSIFLAAAGEGPMTPKEDGLLRFWCALARQCFINEYIFDTTPDELEIVRRMRDRLVRAIEAGGSVPMLWLVAAAAYLPIHSLPGAEALLDRSWSPAVADLLTQQVREPLEERRLRDSIPALTTIADDVSLAVKQQYEENPYPRWVKPAPTGEPRTMARYFGDWFKPSAEPGQQDRIDILVAGCGTGQNLIETARELRSAQVLAVDLSLASLCYAKRQALALGLTNIRFGVADILGLAHADGRASDGGAATSFPAFDIVHASGVLHHMADPWAGWRALLSQLRPGGFMQVGLYSQLARRRINAARAFIAERGYSASAESIRRARQDILALTDGDEAKRIVNYLDFFSASECRDMLFHVQERQMTLLEIAGFLGESDVEFLGFIAEAPIIERFKARFPQDTTARDLALWHVFETENPDAFVGMYQFWIRKNA
jgi:tetratricopeptide (TPR) repeat protein/SAM-dependent methyltransferase